MKTCKKIYSVLSVYPFALVCFAAAVLIGGCQTPQPDVNPRKIASIERLRISTLTEFVPASSPSELTELKVLVELLDAEDSPVSIPCVLRFELYEFRSASSDPRGKRLLIWPEQDLKMAEDAKTHWKELLGGYEFYLPLDFTPEFGAKYVLEATCLTDQGRHNDLLKVRFLPEK